MSKSRRRDRSWNDEDPILVDEDKDYSRFEARRAAAKEKVGRYDPTNEVEVVKKKNMALRFS